MGTWTLDSDFESPEQPFIDFARNRTWTASDGCNRVRGTWDMDRKGDFRTTAGPHTLMTCEGAQLPLAVEQATFATVRGDRMVLHSSSDSTSTRLIRSTDPLVGPQGYPVGYWVESSTPTAPFLSIGADRSFTGSDGCNRLSGSWRTLDDETTVFSGVASTFMQCEGVDVWLSRLASGRVVAGVMTMQSEDGTAIGQLTSLSRDN